MTVNFHQLFFLGVLSAAIHWFIARSDIAAPLWSRARGWFDKLLRCPACSGFWLGLFLWLAGIHVVTAHFRFVEFVVNGMLGLFVTPVFEGVLLWSLAHSAVEPVAEPEAASAASEIDSKLTTTGEVTPTERPPMS